MFEYFPENYPWSATTVGTACRGGEISEIDEACRPLKESAKQNDSLAQQAWFDSWMKLAERIEGLAQDHETAGQ